MSTSAVNSTCSPSSILVTSISGWLTGKMSLSSTAWPYSFGHRVVEGLLQHHGAAETLLDDPGRNLAGAEAGDAHLLRDLLVRRLQALAELLERHLDGEP